MARADVRAGMDSLRIAQRGTPKFVEQVDEITFSGPRALAAGKRVFYATHVGLFELTERGMTLTGLMPGIDLRRDVLDATAMRIVLPASGRVPTLPATLFTTGDWAPPARPVKKRHATRRDRRASA
jgi:propionate CoA-transferase